MGLHQSLSAQDYWIGAVFFVLIFGGSIATAVILVSRRWGSLTGSPRWLATGVLATAALLLSQLVPAVLGILSRESSAVTALLVLAIATRVPPASAADHARYPPPAREATRIDRLAGGFGVAAFGLWIALVAAERFHVEPLGFDAMSAYLPTAANWLQEGSIWGISDWVPSFFFGAGPGNGTAVLLATMLPWSNDFLTHFAMYPFVVMTAVAVYALCREATAPRPAAALIAVALTAAPVVVFPGLRDALLDPVLYASFATGLLFLIRHNRTGERSDLVLAGVALGLALGTKYYGFTAVPIVIAAWFGARLWARTRGPELAKQAAALLIPLLVFGGLWVARNWVETGNPAFPLQVEVLGAEIFDAPEDPLRERLGTTLANYADDPSVWTGELRRQFRIALGLPLVLFAASAVIAIGLLVRRRRRARSWERDRTLVVGLALALALALSYAVTPYSAPGAPGDPFIAAANVRYGIPSLIAFAGIAGWVSGRLGRLGLTAFCLLSLATLFDALRIGATSPRSTVYLAFGLAAVGVAAALALTGSRANLASRWPPALSRRATVGLLVIGAAGLALAGYRVQSTFNETRYIGYDPVLDQLANTDTEGVQIGIAGNWSPEEPAPIYPAFGTRLQNVVDFVGSTDDGVLKRFGAREDFVSALDALDPDLLLIGREARTPEDPASLDQARPGLPVERGWALSAGFEEALRSDRFLLLMPSS